MRVTCAAAALLLCACGSEEEYITPVPLSELPESRTIGELVDPERAALCDWGAAEFGGYGVTLYCPQDGSPFSTTKSQSSCISELRSRSSCRATVGQFMACFRALKARPCLRTLLEKVCIPYTGCLYGVMTNDSVGEVQLRTLQPGSFGTGW